MRLVIEYLSLFIGFANERFLNLTKTADRRKNGFFSEFRRAVVSGH
jgi:hypothetical protein